jgi:hypothetical protein
MPESSGRIHGSRDGQVRVPPVAPRVGAWSLAPMDTRSRLPLALSLLIPALSLAWLGAQGRPFWPASGTVRLWVGDVADPELSQHLLDWYSPSHLLHGILFFGALWLVARRVPVWWRFVVAVAVECAWEVTENSPAVIERYRTTTVSKDYTGDSGLNVLSDVAMMALGFWLARRLPVWASVLIVLGFEALTVWLIRDGLALNVLMLLWPVEGVRDWQGAAW